MKKIRLKILTGRYTVGKISANLYIPAWALQGEFFSITKTDEELSFVCSEKYFRNEKNISAEKNWKIVKIDEMPDFSMNGIISDILSLLSEKKISVLVLSTFNTDYILVKEEKIDSAVNALKEKNQKYYFAEQFNNG